jgi:hypothetical protein
VIDSTESIPAHTSTDAEAFCPPEKKALGGGYLVANSLEVRRSSPTLDALGDVVGNGWSVLAFNPTDDDKHITVYAICATVD